MQHPCQSPPMTQTNIQQHSEPMAVHHYTVVRQQLAQTRCGGDRIFKSRLKPETSKSGRGLLPVMKSHVAPLSEPIPDANKHTRALRTNGSPPSRSGAAIACPEELWWGSKFQMTPPARESQEWHCTPLCRAESCSTLVRAYP